MLFVVGHTEFFVQRCIEVGKPGRSKAAALQGAEETKSSFGVGVLIDPVVQRSRRTTQVGALPGWIGPVTVAERRSDPCIVSTKQGSRYYARLVRKDTSHLPATN